MGAGAAEFLQRHLLPGHRAHDVRSGDEHLRLAVDHHDEIGQGGGVHMAAGIRAHDQRDLRDDAGQVHVSFEDLRVQAQRDNAFLDPGATTLVDADDRSPGLQREIQDLDDLLAVHLAERTAEHPDVLGEDADVAAVHGAVAGDNAITVGAVLRQPEVRRAMPGEGVELDERSGIEQQIDAFPGGELALGVLALDGRGGGGMNVLVHPAVQVGELAGGRVRGGDRRRRVLGWWCGRAGGRFDGVLGARGPTHVQEVTHRQGAAPRK